MIAGTSFVIAAIGSAVKTVVLPRANASRITRSVFLLLRWVFRFIAKPLMSFDRRDRILGAYAPLGLMATLAAWLTGPGRLLADLLGDGTRWLASCVSISPGPHSSPSASRSPSGLDGMVLVFLEAAMGLFLLALLITYLPSIYSAYSRRENASRR